VAEEGGWVALLGRASLPKGEETLAVAGGGRPLAGIRGESCTPLYSQISPRSGRQLSAIFQALQGVHSHLR
jgi:hypothetical protein